MANISKIELANLMVASDGVSGLVSSEQVRAGLHDEDPYAVWYAAKVVGVYRLEELIPDLVALLKREPKSLGDHNTDVHLISAWSLGKFNFELVIQPLMKLVSSENPRTRLAAADVLGEIGDARAIDLLATLAMDADKNVVLWAALSLAKIGKPAQDLLLQLESESAELERKILFTDALGKVAARAGELN